jgi:BirA family biotin operon repressor/biotin-[acetyl-CoA-carboxylase] ligase
LIILPADIALMTDAPPSLLIDPLRLQPLLGAVGDRISVDSLSVCASTNSELYQRAGLGAPSGSVIVTGHQTAGRGSRGRHWAASPQASLTFSLLWRFDGEMSRLAGLSLAVGVGVVRALEACGATGVSLKWPNDILYDNAKLGGILIELLSDAHGPAAVIGLGLNLSLPTALDLDALALKPAALDQLLDPVPERHHLLALLLRELATVLDSFSGTGFAAVRDEWQAHNAWQDKPVQLLREGRIEMEGVCRGADADGALLVQTASGIERCLSGDLSLRAS